MAHALAERGLAVGDRIALGLPNTVELVLAVWGAWKLGATPVPLRWDLPEWEQDRVLEVIAPAVHLARRATGRGWPPRSTGARKPAPDAIAPQTHGICSSGSTGTPKVILIDRPGTWTTAVGMPFPSDWIPIERPQVVLVPSPLYHTNGFMTLYNRWWPGTS